jgi:hypothetical protein
MHRISVFRPRGIQHECPSLRVSGSRHVAHLDGIVEIVSEINLCFHAFKADITPY